MAVLGLLTVVSAAAPRAAHAQTTALFFDSQAGDYVGGGQVATYTTADASFTATTTTYGGTTIRLTAPSYLQSWSLTFKAAGAVLLPGPGTYETARRAPFSESLNGLDVSGAGRGCNALSGRFVVLEAQYDSAGTVLKLSLIHI